MACKVRKCFYLSLYCIILSFLFYRLAGYFSNSSTEQRQADELPYHLSRIADHGRLAHSLVRVPLFEQLSMDKNVRVKQDIMVRE